MKKNTHRLLWSFGLAASHAPLWAHDGHGLVGGHWHATDTLGYAVGLALVIGAWAIGRRK